MEFPDLGKHCAEETCKQLDFLPLKCDACEQDFCKDHFARSAHRCPQDFRKDVRVPVCPLCDQPVPLRRGQVADVVVGEHMDRDCKSLRGKKDDKIFRHRCSRDGCRKREMLALSCHQCAANFCIAHRHPLDHSCPGSRHPVSTAGCPLTTTPRPTGGSLRHWLAKRLRWRVTR